MIRVRAAANVDPLLRLPVQIVFADESQHSTMATITAMRYGWGGAYCVIDIRVDEYTVKRDCTAIALKLPGDRIAPITNGPKALHVNDILHATGRISLSWAAPAPAVQGPTVWRKSRRAPERSWLRRLWSRLFGG